MKDVNPTVGAFLLVVCIVATFVFGKYHVDSGNVISTVLGVGVAVFLGIGHQRTQTQLTKLRESIRPEMLKGVEEKLFENGGFDPKETDTSKIAKPKS